MFREFFGWWFGQLADLLPQRLRRAPPTAADAMVVTPVGPISDGIDAIAVGLRRNGNEMPLGRFSLGAAALSEMPRAAGQPSVLRLGEPDVLGKTVILPLAAERELEQALSFEMDRETPFQTDEIYWSHRVLSADRPNNRLSVRLQLVPKATLAPLLAALGQIGITPERVEVADGPDEGSCLPLIADSVRPRRAAARLVLPAAICCAALAITAAVIPFMRQSAALSSLDQAVASARERADEAAHLRRQIDALSSSADLIRSERDKVGRPLAVLAALTQILPDDTYLTELELQQRKLTVSGRSAAAARLIGAFAADHEFKNPAFAAPVTRIEALKQEIFTIVAEVEP